LRGGRGEGKEAKIRKKEEGGKEKDHLDCGNWADALDSGR